MKSEERQPRISHKLGWYSSSINVYFIYIYSAVKTFLLITCRDVLVYDLPDKFVYTTGRNLGQLLMQKTNVL